MLSQMLVGTWTSVVIGLVAGALATFIGVVIGMTAGFLGGASDEGLSLLTNVLHRDSWAPAPDHDHRLHQERR